MEAAKLTSKGIWQKALDTLRSTRRQTLIITAAGLVAPQVVVDLYFDAAASATGAQMRGLFEAHATKKVPFWELIAPMVTYSGPFFIASLVVIVLATAAYFALVELAVAHMRGDELATAGVVYQRGLGAALRRLPGIFGCLLLLSFFGQVFVAPAILAAVFALVTPVIVVAEGKGSFRAAIDAVTIKYARRTPFSVWGVGFNLLSMAATIYCAFLLVTHGIMELMLLDERVPALHGVWKTHFGSLPIGPVYLVASVVESVLLMAIVALMPALTAALYFTVAQRRVIARA